MSGRYRLGGRASGILLHLTSLPGPYGNGDLGPSAHRFARFLPRAGQRWWQMLPVGPPGIGNSPYGSCSSFAGSPLLVSPEMLRAQGLLDGRELRRMADFPAKYVDFQRSAQHREQWLRAAFERFDRVRRGAQHARFEDFCARNREWLDDFAMFSAIKRAHGGSAWTAWEPDVRRRRDPALAQARRRLAGEVRYQQFVQYEFDREWHALRRHCHDLGVGLIGDLPLLSRPIARRCGRIPSCFALTDRGGRWWWRAPRPTTSPATVSDGITGVYRWDVMKRHRYDFWAPSATRLALRDRFTLPGMRVLQFAFGDDPEAENYQPHNYVRHCVVYTGTHDNDTTVGWFRDRGSTSSTRSRAQIRREREFALRYLNSDGREIHWDMMRAAFGSVADTAIVPLQDVLGLGSESRMNRPGSASGNWAWRCPPSALRPRTAERLATLTATYGRAPTKARIV